MDLQRGLGALFGSFVGKGNQVTKTKELCKSLKKYPVAGEVVSLGRALQVMSDYGKSMDNKLERVHDWAEQYAATTGDYSLLEILSDD
jgi:hypothetical protein